MQRTTASAVRLPVKSHDSQSGFWRQPEQVGNSLRNKAAARASFQMAELAATELTEKLNCETFPKDLAHHREELKSACKTLPEVIVGVLAAYRRKLEEYGIQLTELKLYAELGSCHFSPTIDIMFVLPYGEMQGHNQEYSGRGNFLLTMYREIDNGVQKEITQCCADAGVQNEFRIVSFGAAPEDVKRAHVLLGTL